MKNFSEKVICLEEVDSTNSYIKRAKQEKDTLLIVSAKRQTAGRGRLGRTWQSDGENLYVSYGCFLDLPMEKLPCTTLVAALAVCDALQSFQPMIKWPNDIYLNGRKVCGILCETVQPMGKTIIGIGINANQTVFPDELKERAISLRMASGEKQDLNALLARVSNALKKRLLDFQAFGWEPMGKEYMEKSFLLGKEVQIGTEGKNCQGICIGFSEKGEICLATEKGNISVGWGEANCTRPL